MLIETKLRPPVLRAETVARPRLLERLDRALEGAITVVSAPAGFGKSTLLCQWVQRLAARDVAVGWVSLDEHDDDCGRFLEYLVEAVRRMAPDVAPTLPAALRSSPVLPVDLVLSSVVNGFAARDRIAVLVLDDCHCLTAPDVRRFLDEFAAYAPPTLHVVLATRGPLPIDPFRLRARGRLVQVADADLRFSPDETEQFMNGLRRLDLAGAELSALQERTEGWAAGLQLASLSLGERAGRADFIRRFTGTQKDVAGFLLGDVIARLPDDLFGFLMRTAILDRISAPLADAVTGRDDGASMLARVERANLFVIPLDAHGAWVRYHHLFGELLRSLLVERHADEVRILHRRAAPWFHAHGSTGDAVQHALAAGDDGLAAELVERCAMPLIMQSHITRVRAWLNALPAALVQARPRLLLAQVWVQFHVSRAREAATLRHARDAIGRAHGAGEIGADELEALQAELYTLTAGVVSAADRSRSAARLAERWLERVPPAYGFCRGTLGNILGFCHYSLGRLDPARVACLRARDSHAAADAIFGTVYSDLILGLVEVSAGNLQAGHQLFTQAVKRARDSLGAGSYAEAMVAVFEAELLYEWNDTEGAERLLAEHGQLIEECGLVVHDMACKLLVARLAAARGARDEALAVLERAERLGLARRYRRLFASALDERVRLLLAGGERQAAAAILRARGITPGRVAAPQSRGPAAEPEAVALARVLIAEGRYEAALTVLDRVAESARADGRLRRFTQVRALAAIAAYRGDDALNSLAAVVDAVSLGAAQGAVRSLTDEGEALCEVVRFARERMPSWRADTAVARHVTRLLALWESSGPAAASPTGPPRRSPRFSRREADVARLLTGGQSNREMASRLAMAPDTVKWHLKNIYGKLGVSNRTQAVLRLQELGLTSPGGRESRH